MEINIDRYALKMLYEQYKKNLYHSGHGTLYKVSAGSINSPIFLGERISFVDGLSFKDGYTYPISLLKDKEGIYGYELELLDGYSTFSDLLNLPKMIFNSKFPFEVKKRLLLGIHKTLKEINKDYIVGDITLDNLMVNTNGQGMIIDWENGAPIGSNIPVFPKDHIGDFLTDLQEDALKAFIASLSMLYAFDFESFVKHHSFWALYEFNFAEPINDYLDAVVLDMLISKPVYFDEFLKHLKPITQYQGFLVRQRAKNFRE